jgi:hypothetical protein
VTNKAGTAMSTNVTLTVSGSGPARPQLSSVVYTNGVFCLTVSGDPGHDYILQTSSNLTDWSSIFTDSMPTPPFNWSDGNAGNFTQRFYRVLVGP